MYICKKCRATCEFPRVRVISHETRYSPEESEQVKCDCGGSFVKAQTCIVCEQDCMTSELTNGICKYCIEDEAEYNGYDYALKIGDNNRTSVDVNSFIANLFTSEEINTILLSYLEANRSRIENLQTKCKRFCLTDMDCFADYVEEKVRND